MCKNVFFGGDSNAVEGIGHTRHAASLYDMMFFFDTNENVQFLKV